MAAAADTVFLEEVPRRSQSPAGRALRKLVRKKIAMVAIAYLLVFYCVGTFASVLPAIQDPYQQHLTVQDRRQGPSSEHWFGTDALGRDLAARVVYAARITVLFTVIITLSGSLVLGLGLGLLSGYRGGWIDTAIMRIGEVLSGIPTLVLMLAILGAFRTRISDVSYWLKQNSWLGDSSTAVVQFSILALATLPFSWLGTARIVRAQALQLRESAFVEAAESYGASSWRVITRHIFPGVMPLYMVGLSSGMAGIAGLEVGLSFLGLGITGTTPSFGTLLADVASPKTFADYPHLLLAPGIPVILFFYAWNLLGDALVDILEPRVVAR